MGRGTTPLLHFLPTVVVWPYCVVALTPHLCHGHNCGSANPPFKNPAYGPGTVTTGLKSDIESSEDEE